MPTTDLTPIRLTGRRGLVAAVPALLGFHPRESVVLLCLRSPTRRIGPVIRVDLEDDAAHPSDFLIAQLTVHANRHAHEVAVLCFTERQDVPRMVHELIAALQRTGVCVLDAACVREGYVRSVAVSGHELGSGTDAWEPCSGVPAGADPQIQALAAASVLSGRGILADRQALRNSIAGPVGERADSAASALHVAADGLLGRAESDPIDHDQLLAMARRTIKRALHQTAARGAVDGPTSALLTLLMCDTGIRDQMVAEAVTDLESPWVPMLIAVATSVPDGDAAEVCAVLAVAAYRRGDGALAQVAVDRCLSAEPDHRLAHLMLAVMAAGLPPDELEHLATPRINQETDE